MIRRWAATRKKNRLAVPRRRCIRCVKDRQEKERYKETHRRSYSLSIEKNARNRLCTVYNNHNQRSLFSSQSKMIFLPTASSPTHILAGVKQGANKWVILHILQYMSNTSQHICYSYAGTKPHANGMDLFTIR